MGYRIDITDAAEAELRSLRVFERRKIVDAIQSQLGHQPTEETRHRKRLDSAIPAFDHLPPIWELRVGDYRVFYDIDESALIVVIRAVRRKLPEQTTDEVLREGSDD
jgi:mRNA-degrading endonuclease RelE of RelBE toxin-antitoxin system